MAEFNDGQVVSPPNYLEEAVGFMINLTVPWRGMLRDIRESSQSSLVGTP